VLFGKGEPFSEWCQVKHGAAWEPHVIITLVSGSTAGADFRQGVEVGKEIDYFVSVSSLQR
jgi:hypothetical protein